LNLTDVQIDRYRRHVLLEEVGAAGQEKLLAARVLLVGVGGLGSPAALYLAAAGVGIIGLVDADAVDISNLQRQVIHHTPDIGVLKVASAAAKMCAINPDVTVNPYSRRLQADNAKELIRDYDFVIDATDNFESKFLINDACVLGGKPFCHGGIFRFSGQLMTVLPRQTTCYRCVFQEPPPVAAGPAAGPIGALAGVMGCLQALEAIKFILGLDGLLLNSLQTFDSLKGEFRRIHVSRNPACPVCGTDPTITELKDETGPA
jgi:molybdopterin/thiamine biosynthesis adenylyltransferase